MTAAGARWLGDIGDIGLMGFTLGKPIGKWWFNGI